MRRLLPLLIFLLLAADARASCIYPEPRRQIRSADAAFVGRYESGRGDGMGKRWLTFRVERVVKGELGETVEIYEPGITSAGLPNFEAGDRVGLMMDRHTDGTWRSMCQLADPEELADALKPIERPPGRGAATFLVSGDFGDKNLVALDRRGRTLGYASVGGWPAALCPDGRLVVLDHRRDRYTLRRTRDLEVLARRATPNAAFAHCGRDGVFVVGSMGIYRGTRRIWTGEWSAVAFSGGDAFVIRDRTLLQVDLGTGRERSLTEIPLSPQHESPGTLAVNGRYVAILAVNASVQPGEPPSRLAVYDRRTKRLRVADMAASDLYGEVVWAADDRFAFLPMPVAWWAPRGERTALFYGADLQPRGEVPGWSVRAALGGGGAVVGIVGHRLERGSPSGHSELGRLPGSNVSGLFTLGSRAEIRWSRRIPRY